MSEFGEFIVNMRSAAGMEQAELAYHLCLSITTLEAYERGKKIPHNPLKFEYHLREIIKAEIRNQREDSLAPLQSC